MAATKARAAAPDMLMKSLRLSSTSAPIATRWFAFAALALSFLILSPIAFHSKFPLVFYRFDGIYLLIAAVMQKTWSVSDWYFTSNPLQGIGGLELPQHDLIDPGLWRAAHLPASIGPTVAMTFLRRPACGNHMLAADPPADGSQHMVAAS